MLISYELVEVTEMIFIVWHNCGGWIDRVNIFMHVLRIFVSVTINSCISCDRHYLIYIYFSPESSRTDGIIVSIVNY